MAFISRSRSSTQASFISPALNVFVETWKLLWRLEMGCLLPWCLACKIPICPNLENCCRAINCWRCWGKGQGVWWRSFSAEDNKREKRREIIIYREFNYAINIVMALVQWNSNIFRPFRAHNLLLIPFGTSGNKFKSLF